MHEKGRLRSKSNTRNNLTGQQIRLVLSREGSQIKISLIRDDLICDPKEAICIASVGESKSFSMF